jgi:hypothetical protein
MISFGFGHSDRSAALTSCAQHWPAVVAFAGEQHAPLAVGMRPEAQHKGPIGTWKIGPHALLLAPLGALPAGQHTPVEVTLLARQQEPPAGT